MEKRRKASELSKRELVKMIATLRDLLYAIQEDYDTDVRVVRFEIEEAFEETNFDDDLSESPDRDHEVLGCYHCPFSGYDPGHGGKDLCTYDYYLPYERTKREDGETTPKDCPLREGPITVILKKMI